MPRFFKIKLAYKQHSILPYSFQFFNIVHIPRETNKESLEALSILQPVARILSVYLYIGRDYKTLLNNIFGCIGFCSLTLSVYGIQLAHCLHIGRLKLN